MTMIWDKLTWVTRQLKLMMFYRRKEEKEEKNPFS